jgi:hypothetical protein
LNNSEATGKIAKWAIELSIYDIVYKPRTTIKAQALRDFMAEWTETQTTPQERELEYWTINFVSHLVLGPNGMLIVCVPRNQIYTHTVQKMGTE